ncbi:MAG: hypothetical protein NZ740_10520, partial [Kiritimatiellae bacterium]|nr:hypothetical protein [Kiritimatiellia bacterium]MDW8459519.1 hypothetical protein [Verrucomicrobiota bacterium]
GSGSTPTEIRVAGGTAPSKGIGDSGAGGTAPSKAFPYGSRLPEFAKRDAAKEGGLQILQLDLIADIFEIWLIEET